jgi:hypothetical protein
VPSDDQGSLGDLVALAAKDVSQLIRYEIDLAKSELRADVRRAAMSGALFGFAGFIACLVLVLLTFALAYGLKAAGVPGGGGLYVCFAYAALILVILAAGLVFAAIYGMKRFSGMRQTRKTVTEGVGMLRQRGTGSGDTGPADTGSADTGSADTGATPVSTNGTRPATTSGGSAAALPGTGETTAEAVDDRS